MPGKPIDPMLDAVKQIADTGELVTLLAGREHLATALGESLVNVLALHATVESNGIIWCGMCQRLMPRKHTCTVEKA